MQYYDQNDRRGRMWAAIGVAAYVAVCVGVMMVSYRLALPEPETGILIDFGTSDYGTGDVDPAAGDTAERTQPTPDDETVLTVEQTDAPEIVSPPEPEQSTPPTPQPEPTREVDRRALFPGRTEGNNTSAQGKTPGEGNQGAAQGKPGGNDGFSLDGRYVVGTLPRPAYDVQAEGRVVIEINVNAEGTVTTAAYRQAGSTTNDGTLVSAARTAALRARFTPAEAELQTGTITYIFRLN